MLFGSSASSPTLPPPGSAYTSSSDSSSRPHTPSTPRRANVGCFVPMSSTKLLALQREQQRTGGQGVRPLSTSFAEPDAAPVHDVLGELNGVNTIRRVGGPTPSSSTGSLAGKGGLSASFSYGTPLPLTSPSSRVPGPASAVTTPSAPSTLRGPVPSPMPRIRAPTSGLATPSASAAMRRSRTPQPPPAPTISVSHPGSLDDGPPSPSAAESSSSLFPRIKAKLTDASRTRKKPLPGPAHVVTPHKLGVYRGGVAEETFLSSDAIREFDSGGEDDDWSMIKDQDDAFWDEGAGTTEKENVKVSIRYGPFLESSLTRSEADAHFPAFSFSVRPLNPLSTADYSIWEASGNQLKLADGAGRRGAKEDWTFGACPSSL